MQDKEGSTSPSTKSSIWKTISDLEKQYIGLFRAGKFAIAGTMGFIVSESILAIGVLILYGKIGIPSHTYSSPSLLALNIVAAVTSTTAGFFINERITVRNQGEQRLRAKKNVIIRLVKFLGVYALGNVISIGVQLGLLATVSLTPVLGNVVGAVVAFPPSYLISMKFVWKVGLFEQGSNQSARFLNQV